MHNIDITTIQKQKTNAITKLIFITVHVASAETSDPKPYPDQVCVRLKSS